MSIQNLTPVHATPLSIEGYATWVDDYDIAPIDVVQWPNQGDRALTGGYHAPVLEDSLTLRWMEDQLQLIGDSPYGEEEQRTIAVHQVENDRDMLIVDSLQRRLDSGVVLFAVDAHLLLPISIGTSGGAPKNVKVFEVREGTGLHIAPGTWFGDPLTQVECAVVKRKHGSVRASHHYNIRTEAGSSMTIKAAARMHMFGTAA